MNAAVMTACDLCDSDGGALLFQGAGYRVVLVDEPGYPGFCRVIWHAHVKEMSDLSVPDRAAVMTAVWEVEAAMREVMQPQKINLASLGNMTPHVHWHVIPRYADDLHFPSPIWAEARRAGDPALLAQRQALLPALRSAIVRRLEALG
jgi:diadenosine tetraphosphate (Ap4A) HIT family hydrolase